jgi:uncharacterized Rmd1/YagE family protein
LTLQQRLADRVDLDEKPDVLWDHPELERFWARLVDEYDLPQRGRAIARKLEVIRDTAETITDLMATRTSHRLEVYIIGLIAFEIGLSLYDQGAREARLRTGSGTATASLVPAGSGRQPL